MVAYVKHRKMLKSKQSKPMTGSDVPLSPSQLSVRSSQPVPVFDIEARITSLRTELSEGVGSSLQQDFLALSSDLSTQLAARISSTSCTLTPSVSAPVRPDQALSPHPPVSTAGLLQLSQALGEVDRNPKVFSVPLAVLREDSNRMVGEAAQSRQVPDATVPPSKGLVTPLLFVTPTMGMMRALVRLQSSP